MSKSIPTPTSGPPTIRLPLSVGIRECAVLRDQLLPLLEIAEDIVVDVTGVERIDTAALQLLFAFSRDRTANGLSTVWNGDSPAFRSTAETVDLNVCHEVPYTTTRAN